MSVEEIQARIDAISGEITRQKEILKNLERSKSAAQCQLNACRDPVARLPLELSSAIFIQCLPVHEEPSARHAPMLFLNVCHPWTDIALATPALWATVYADSPKADLESLLDTWLKRAGSRPLSISLPAEITHGITAVMRQHAHRLQDLKLNCDVDEDTVFARDIGSLPFLRTLTIVGVKDSSCSTAGTLAMLRACPALFECALENVSYPLADAYYNTEMMVLPHMQHLKVGIHSDDHILRYITLPALQILFIPFEDPRIQVLDLVHFLRRSAPPLHTLSVGDVSSRARWTLHEMQECLSLLPKLAHIELVGPRDSSMDHFLTALVDAPHLVPILSSVTFRMSSSPEPSSYHKLLNMLMARRTQVRSVRVIWDIRVFPGLSEEASIQLRQLVANGMEIYIGTKYQNLFSISGP
ncbi:hypothetical protein FB451DRAFT_771653 [Mycena latifolia]|nr:hypothetical protein FB451DRAFT_771653 [Mycena latifolia]